MKPIMNAAYLLLSFNIFQFALNYLESTKLSISSWSMSMYDVYRVFAHVYENETDDDKLEWALRFNSMLTNISFFYWCAIGDCDNSSVTQNNDRAELCILLLSNVAHIHSDVIVFIFFFLFCGDNYENYSILQGFCNTKISFCVFELELWLERV